MARTTPLPRPPRSKVKLPPVPAEPLKVDFNTMPMGTVMRIERMAGSRMSAWAESGPSDAQLTIAVVAAVYDVDFDIVAEENAETLSKYVEIVTPDDAEDEDDDPGNG
jgi:hypothetical protein